MADEVRYESVTIQGEMIEPGKLIWRRYRVATEGIVEIFLDINPHLRQHLATSPFLPVGVSVLIPIVPAVLNESPRSMPTVRLWGTAQTE